MSVAIAQPSAPTTTAAGERVRDIVRSKWSLAVVALLVIALYATNFLKLVSDWNQDENYSHGYLVPVIFAWIIWTRRRELAAVPVKSRWWGMLLVIAGLAQLAAGRLGAENFVAHTSLLVVLSGIVLYLFGTGVFRLVWFPIVWLLFMIPIPKIVFYAITFPLQLLASSMAAKFLDLWSIPNLREGNIIYLPNYSMGVAEACSGIRSLFSLFAVAALIAFMRPMKAWARLALFLAAVPIALVINSLRVAGTGIVGNYLDQRYAEGFVHTFSGWVLFIGATALLVALSQLLVGKRDKERLAS